MTMIASPSNPLIKQVRKLREKKERQASGLYYIEGLHIVAEAAQQQAQIETLLVAPELLISEFGQEIVRTQAKRGTQVVEVSRTVFEGMALKDGPQVLAALVRQQWFPLAEVTPKGFWVGLDAVADPGNLGTILRTHDSVGGKGLILLDQSTDPYDPTAIRASMGAIFTQRLVKATFTEFADWKRQVGMPLVGTSGASKKDYATFQYPSAMVLLMGSERQGLLEHHLQLCDAVVRIPMCGRSDSLNLAVATAVVLYEMYNQQRGRSTYQQA